MSLTVRKSEKFTIISHHVREDTTITRQCLVVFYCFQPKWGVPMGQVRPSAHPTFPTSDQPPFRAGGGGNEIAEGAAGVGKLREGAGFYDAITVGGIVVKLAENNDLIGIPNR